MHVTKSRHFHLTLMPNN